MTDPADWPLDLLTQAVRAIAAIYEEASNMKTIDQMIDELVEREGGYVDNPADHGGPTKYGITELKARAHGWTGAMQDLPLTLAHAIYWQDYVVAPGIQLLAQRSQRLAAEALDTGVNMGATIGVTMLQTALNALNNGGKDWPDLAKLDGNYGGKTDAALAACQRVRANQQWEDVLLEAMNCLQGARYLTLTQKEPRDEVFAWGWLRNRVLTPALAA